MPVLFDTKSTSPVSTHGNQPSSKPELTVMQKWLATIHDGLQRQSLSPRSYCERAWTKETGTPASQMTQAFKDSCQMQSNGYKAWSISVRNLS